MKFGLSIAVTEKWWKRDNAGFQDYLPFPLFFSFSKIQLTDRPGTGLLPVIGDWYCIISWAGFHQ